MKGRPRGTRWHLLTTASSVALIASVYSAHLAEAAESDSEPSVWVELGVHSDRVRNSNDSFALPFGNEIPSGGLTGPLAQGLELSRSDGEDGKITFRPDGTNWVFSASITYGRSRGKSRINQSQPIPTTTFATYHTTIPTYPRPYHKTTIKPVKVNGNSLLGDAITTETHTIVDFSAGKDVGLGMLGRGSSSVVGAGVRFANFTSKLNVPQARADVDVHFTQVNQTFPTLAFFPSGVRVVPWYFTSASQVWHNVNASGTGSHSFRGVGPSVYWDASVPVVGDPHQGSSVSLDWGINAAILFGKQKNSEVHHSSSAYNCYGRICDNVHVQYAPRSSEARSAKNVTVPNLGGFAGVSYRVAEFKASAGYRADFFFHAIGTKIDVRKTSNTAFHGPFATISIGLL